MEYSLNLNCTVKVKLTNIGKEIFYHQYDDFNKRYPARIITPHYPEEDENGYAKFQLWDFMSTYGNHIGMTMEAVIFPLEIIMDGNDLGICAKTDESDGEG